MMKLYYSAGSCSTSCHIALEESGLPYEAIEVDFDNANDPNVDLINKLNPLGTLPILITEDGKQLDQNIAIQTYIAEKVPAKKLLPAAGTYERAAAENWLSFVAADLHKSVGALFGVPYYSEDKNVQSAVRKFHTNNALNNLKYLDAKLAGKDYLMGSQFTVADGYAFIVVSWTKYLDIPLAPYPNIEKYMARMAARPAVAKVLTAEGLN